MLYLGFGVEGCEALLVGLEALVARCAEHGVRRIELGMPHRSTHLLACDSYPTFLPFRLNTDHV